MNSTFSGTCRATKILTAVALSVLAVDYSFAQAAANEVQSWYPRTATSDKGKAVIHAPQIDAWSDFETLTGWTAFSVSVAGSDAEYAGSLHFEAKTDTDLAEREVLLHDAEILDLQIDGLSSDSPEYRLISEGFQSASRTVPLDLILEYLPREIPVTENAGLNSEAPPIFVATSPAILLTVDSEPVFIPLADTSLRFLLNTNWDVIRDGEDGPLYLCYALTWLTADALDAKWRWAKDLPAAFSDIPDDENWNNVQTCLPDDLRALKTPPVDAPKVYYSIEPAELIIFDGEPQWTAIAEGAPEYATNSAQEVFRVDGQFYFLASGRWFQASTTEGPWQRAGDLPAVFQNIPAPDSANASEKSYIRKSVPGTREAWEAALVASIPRKASIVRGTEAELNLSINYAGDPAFAPIDGTNIEMAANTSYQVFRYDGKYFLCHNAVWLTSDSAEGPWTFADLVPEEFDKIPPSSPAFNTTFVSVADSDDETIDVEYTSGYEGVYVEDETVVQGTGYANSAVAITIAYGIYDGWWGYPYYPYYPWPPTYGYGSWYDPDTGRYGEAVVGYGPYGAAGSAAVFNPETGVYARGQAVWDSDEYAGRGYAYNPNTNTSIARNRYIDFEDNEGWSQNVARRGDEWRYSQSEWEDGRMATEFESSRGTEGTVYREREGDAIVSEGTITGENRSATFEGSFEDGQGQMTFEGSEGGTGSLNRQIEEGEISGSGSFTKDGKTIDTDVTRTAEGVQRDFETSSGGQAKTFRRGDDSAFVAESGSGDMYAGRDGNVYKKSEDGWAPVQNPGASANAASSRRVDQAGARTQSQPRFDSTYSGGGMSLDRDYQSRQRGFDRYSTHQSSGARRSRGGYNRRRRR